MASEAVRNEMNCAYFRRSGWNFVMLLLVCVFFFHFKMLENDCGNRNLFCVFQFLNDHYDCEAHVELPFRWIRFIDSQIQLGFRLKSDFKNLISNSHR